MGKFEEDSFERGKALERIHSMLKKVLPKVTDSEVKKVIQEAILQSRIIYLNYPIPKGMLADEAAIAAAVSRAKEKAKEDGEPSVVAVLPSRVLITRRSRLRKERPFGASLKDVIFDSEKGWVAK